jgi:hypothetical protein
MSSGSGGGQLAPSDDRDMDGADFLELLDYFLNDVTAYLAG